MVVVMCYGGVGMADVVVSYGWCGAVEISDGGGYVLWCSGYGGCEAWDANGGVDCDA